MNWYLKVMQENYTNFNGRARRKEYWMWYLFYWLVLLIAIMLDSILGINFDMGYGAELPYGPIYLLAALIHFIPGFALTVRRLHDVGKSGWFLLIAFVPIIGAIWLFILSITDSDAGENKYGVNPKEIL